MRTRAASLRFRDHFAFFLPKSVAAMAATAATLPTPLAHQTIPSASQNLVSRASLTFKNDYLESVDWIMDYWTEIMDWNTGILEWPKML